MIDEQDEEPIPGGDSDEGMIWVQCQDCEELFQDDEVPEACPKCGSTSCKEVEPPDSQAS